MSVSAWIYQFAIQLKEGRMEVPKSLRKALALVKSGSEGVSKTAKLAKSLRPLLEAAIGEISAMGVTRPSRRGTGEMNYIVETTQQGEVLTEERVGGTSKPFRCPKSIYDALSFVLEGTERPLSLHEIMAALESRLSDRPADHQVRVALRLWMHANPPLVSRSRARYQRIDLSNFLVKTKTLWDRMKSLCATNTAK